MSNSSSENRGGPTFGWVFPDLGIVLTCVLITYSALVWFGVKTFSPWQQVLFLWNSGRPLPNLVNEFHFARYMVAYPGLALEEALPDKGFSLYVIAMILIAAVQFDRIHRLVAGRSPQVWLWLAFLPLFLLMNGRGAIGWAGWLTCLYAALAWRRAVPTPGFTRSIVRIMFGLFLASVTSGIFVICLGFVIYCFVFPKPGGWRFRTRVRLDPLLPVLAILSASLFILLTMLAGFYFQEAFLKAVRFFGGGLDGVLGLFSHGLLSSVQRFDHIHFLLIALLGCLNLLFLFSVHAKRIGMDLLVAFYLPAAGIAGGFTLATLALPSFLLILGKLYRLKMLQEPRS